MTAILSWPKSDSGLYEIDQTLASNNFLGADAHDITNVITYCASYWNNMAVIMEKMLLQQHFLLKTC